MRCAQWLLLGLILCAGCAPEPQTELRSQVVGGLRFSYYPTSRELMVQNLQSYPIALSEHCWRVRHGPDEYLLDGTSTATIELPALSASMFKTLGKEESVLFRVAPKVGTVMIAYARQNEAWEKEITDKGIVFWEGTVTFDIEGRQ